jgi:tetratricopeptide (TPR) repeat protein
VLEQSRKINEELGAHRAMAYDIMNLGCIYMATGDHRKARQMFDEAFRSITPSQDRVGIIYILLCLACLLVETGDALGASRRYSEARELAISQELNALAYESTSGLAACAIMQGKLEEAEKYVDDAWNYLKVHGWLGMNNPGRAYLNCVETFEALGATQNARAALEAGHQTLLEVADKINVPEWRLSFLENLPEHRALMEMWDRSEGKKESKGLGDL